MPKYESYQEGFEKENLMNIAAQTEELKQRKKMEESISILATMGSIAAVAKTIVVVMKVLVMLGIIEVASTIAGM